MLDRTHVAPFTRVAGDTATVEFLRDSDGRIVAFLDRLVRLVRRLQGRERALVLEMLRRQERRVRDSSRLAGVVMEAVERVATRPPARRLV